MVGTFDTGDGDGDDFAWHFGEVLAACDRIDQTRGMDVGDVWRAGLAELITERGSCSAF